MQNLGQIVFNQNSQDQTPDTNSGVKAEMEYKDPKKEGRDDAIQEITKDVEKGKRKLETLSKRAERIILQATNIFPFDLFPDQIIVDETKVSIVYKEFFWSESIQPILLDSITDVVVETSLFFGKLKIINFNRAEVVVEWLWKKDALEARRVIQGLVVAKKAGVDFTAYEVGELKEKVSQLGQARP